MFRQSAALAVGSGAAQAIGLAASPLVTRLFSPDDYAVFTVFSAAVAMVLPIACGKYDVAVVVAGTDRHASQLVRLCLWVAGAVGLVILGVAVPFHGAIASALNCDAMNFWLFATPLAVGCGAAASAYRSLANRHALYADIGRSLVVQSCVSVTLNLCLGCLGFGAAGLIISNVIAFGIGAAQLARRLRCAADAPGLNSGTHLLHVAAKYRDFPLFNATSSLLDAATLAMPVFFISRLCALEVVGCYGLMIRVAQVPFAVTSAAVSQVCLRQVSELVRRGGPAGPYFLTTAAVLATASALPVVLLVLWAPPMFALAFGEPWRESGEILTVMMPALAVQFVVSTLSPVCGATGNNGIGAAWKLLAFVCTFWFFAQCAPTLGHREMFQSFALLNIGLYALYFLMLWYAAANPKGVA